VFYRPYGKHEGWTLNKPFQISEDGRWLMNDNRLVYSTETGRICTGCGKPVSGCVCKKRKKANPPKQSSQFPDDGIIRIQREVKGRKGKTVTVVFGVPLDAHDLKKFAKTLKSRCGAGGSVKEGLIIIQGDHRQTLLGEIKKLGYKVKLAGG
jgi:translation initiation factor 1